jgi:pimeloyl-ACP methyl ester carboxylesterase
LFLAAFLPLAPAFAQTDSLPPGTHDYLIPVALAESLRITIRGSGQTVVLIPGLFGSAFGYRHLLSLLPAAGFRTIVVEPLGIGRSPRPRHADYSLTAQADRVARVLEGLGESAAIVVGHSVATSIALRLAYRHPERVRAVIALDGGPSEQAATAGLRRAMRYAPWVKWLGGMKRIRPEIRKGLIAASGDPSWVTDRVMDGYTAGAKADLDGTLLAFLAMSESKEREHLSSHLGHVRCPVRLVLGTARHTGGVEPAHVRLMQDRIADFTIETIPGAGQYLFEEQPSPVVEVIRRVASITTATAASTR